MELDMNTYERAAQKAVKRTLMYRAQLNTITAEEAAKLLAMLKREKKGTR